MSTSSQWQAKSYTPRHDQWPYTEADFRRTDESSDTEFYGYPRLVTHIDDHAIDTLGRYYEEVLPSKGKILDFCSSWISHYPSNLEAAIRGGALSVTGMGMSKVELDRNGILATRIVQDLNVDPTIPQMDPQDAATCVVSIDYLIRPVQVLESIRDRLSPGARVHLIISNRCFSTKAVTRWLRISEEERLQMVGDYLHFAGYTDIEILTLSDSGRYDPLWVVRGTR